MIDLNFHGVTQMIAKQSGNTSWLSIRDDAGCYVSIFMPYEAARMMEAAWKAWLDVGKPATEAPTITTQGSVTCAEW